MRFISCYNTCMKIRKHIVVINQHTHMHKIQHLLAEMEETFKRKNFCYAFHTTQVEEGATAIYQSQSMPCRFYVFGGDGTLHQAINNLNGTQHEIVLLPIGTGNDFSRMLKDHKNIYQHFRNSINREAISIDVLKVNDAFCVNAACFALDQDIANHVHDTTWHYTPRKLAYLTTILRRMFRYQCTPLKVIVDGEERFFGAALFAACNNAKFYGGGFCMTPKADLRDGYMDVCIIKQLPKWKILIKFPIVLMKQAQRLPESTTFQCKRAIFESLNGVNLDGERYENHIFHIEVMEKSLLIVNEIK